jgi:hypothetical protein
LSVNPSGSCAEAVFLSFCYLRSRLRPALFIWALIAAGVGVVSFLAAVSFVRVNPSQQATTVNLVSGAVIEAISGLDVALSVFDFGLGCSVAATPRGLDSPDNGGGVNHSSGFATGFASEYSTVAL